MPAQYWTRANPIGAPVAALVVAMISFQVGAAVAKTLIPSVGAAGAAALRLGLATLMLWLVRRPWRSLPKARDAGTIALYGIALGCMNLLFYLALQRVPLGIAVALEFTGPLALAMASSSRLLDFLWISCAALGLCLLLPLGAASQGIDRIGALSALGAGMCWALYILFGRRAGIAHGAQTAALGMLIGALVVVPIGVAQAGIRLWSPAVLPAALAVALLSSALPYSLEMFAMPRLPTRTVGVLMSLGPALAALAGLGFLDEHLTWTQWFAIFSIMLASAGSAATSRRDTSSAAVPE